MENEFNTGMIMDAVNAPIETKAAEQPGEMVETSAETLQNVIANSPSANMQYYIPKPKQQVRKHAKIGRNDSCPCGSGKKYKNCCLASGKYEEYEDA